MYHSRHTEMIVDAMMCWCYCEQPTVVGQLLCQKVVVRAPADDSVAASLMIVSMFLVVQGNFSCHLTAFHLSHPVRLKQICIVP